MFSAIAPTPPIQRWENLSYSRTTFLGTPHHCKGGGGRGIFPIFFMPSKEKNWQCFVFHIFLFFVKKRFFEKVVIFFGVNKLLWRKVLITPKKWSFFRTSYLRLFSDHGLNATFPRSFEYAVAFSSTECQRKRSKPGLWPAGGCKPRFCSVNNRTFGKESATRLSTDGGFPCFDCES